MKSFRHQSNSKYAPRQSGLSLVELMVAIAVGGIITAGVLQIFLSNKASYRTQEGLIRVQENARFAISALEKEIRMAGYKGCMRSVSNINITINGIPADFVPVFGVQGWEASGTAPTDSVTAETDFYYSTPTTTTGESNGWQTSDPDNVAANDVLTSVTAVPNSDIVRIWRGDTTSVNMVSVNEGTQANPQTPVAMSQNITLSSTIDYTEGDVFIISDCASADIVMACNNGSTASITSNIIDLDGCGNAVRGNNPAIRIATQAQYGQATRLVANTFYIAKQADASANPPAIYQRPLGSNAAAAPEIELIRGVENMQILYGLDSTGDGAANQYVTADNVSCINPGACTGWDSVVSVKIALLMVSENNALPSKTDKSFVINGTTIDPKDDLRLRKIYSKTILLRNQTI